MLECVYARRRRESAYRGAGATGLTVRSIMAGGGILLRFRLLAAGSAVSSGSGACSALSSGSGAGSGVPSGSGAGSGVSSGSGVGSGVSSGSGVGSGVSSGSCAGPGSVLGVSSGEAWVELVSAEEAGSFSPQDVRKRQRQKAAEMTVSASFMTALSFADISALTRIISEILFEESICKMMSAAIGKKRDPELTLFDHLGFSHREQR